MKVNESSLQQSSSAEISRARQSEAVSSGSQKRNAARQAGSDDDQVQLSGLSSRLLSLAETGPPGQAARVQQLSAQYKAGSYQPNASAVSHSIVQEAMAS